MFDEHFLGKYFHRTLWNVSKQILNVQEHFKKCITWFRKNSGYLEQFLRNTLKYFKHFKMCKTFFRNFFIGTRRSRSEHVDHEFTISILLLALQMRGIQLTFQPNKYDGPPSVSVPPRVACLSDRACASARPLNRFCDVTVSNRRMR